MKYILYNTLNIYRVLLWLFNGYLMLCQVNLLRCQVIYGSYRQN